MARIKTFNVLKVDNEATYVVINGTEVRRVWTDTGSIPTSVVD